jgi:photosystem II stability/assembly factor-like uncharacterized protein
MNFYNYLINIEIRFLGDKVDMIIINTHFLILKSNKTILFLLFILFFLTNPSYGQWVEQNSGVGIGLYDVCFVDNLYGWTVGENGTVISTTNGGENWLKKFEPSDIFENDSIEMKQVQFIDRNVGFIGGNIITKFPTYEARKALLIRTINGGLSWERCDSAFDSAMRFSDMQFLDPAIGFIALNNTGQNSWNDRKGVLLKTTDSGITWFLLQEREILLIGAITFWSEDTGYSFWSVAVDNYDNTEVYFTQNGGVDWMEISTINEEVVQKAKCFSPNIIWSIGYAVSRSSNGGKTWNSWNWFSPIPAGQKRFKAADIEILDEETIWIIGAAYTSPYDREGVFIFTNDFGEHWWIGLKGPYYSFYALSISGTNAWIVGGDGFIIHNRNIVTNIKEDIYIQPMEIEQNYPNPFNLNTQIRFSISDFQHVTLKIFDVLGKEIVTLLNEKKSPGIYIVTWDAFEQPSGIYFYKLETNAGFIQTKKLVLLK